MLNLLIAALPPNPLTQLNARIEHVLRSEGIKASNLSTTDDLAIQYRTASQQVFPHYKNGSIGKRSFEEYWPTRKGFLIHAILFEHRPSDPAPIHQEVHTSGYPTATTGHGAHWLYDYYDRQVPNTDQALHIELRWGPNLDQKLLTRLISAIKTETTEMPAAK